jgi:hypothetical protein
VSVYVNYDECLEFETGSLEKDVRKVKITTYIFLFRVGKAGAAKDWIAPRAIVTTRRVVKSMLRPAQRRCKTDHQYLCFHHRTSQPDSRRSEKSRRAVPYIMIFTHVNQQ